LASGVTVTVLFPPLPPNTIFPLGTIASSLDAPESKSEPAGSSISSMVNAMGIVDASSLIERSAMAVIVGASLTEVTVTINASVGLNSPSLKVIVMVEDPVRLATGVTVTVRVEPLPPKTTLASGIKDRLLDTFDTVKSPIMLSTSAIVNVKGLVDPSSGIG
jgi:hypothetical protein